MNNLISKNKHALIRIAKIVLDVKHDVTQNDVDTLKLIMQNHLDSGMSPADIKKFYNIEYTDFGMFLKKCLNLQLKTLKAAINNYNKQTGKSVTDEKQMYKKQCAFIFDPYSIPEIPGYNLLLEFGIYHPTNNPNGVCRDHMVSVEYGWRNKIDPNIISNSANCQFITNLDNIKKGEKSAITIDELKARIENNCLEPVVNKSLFLPRTLAHRQKISNTNIQYMRITDGIKNIRILKTDPIPEGFRRGFVRKNKVIL